MDKNSAFILWFDQLGIEDVPLVGGKNASLGEMYRLLTPKGVNIPNGFAVTATAYRYLMEKSGAVHKIKEILSDLNTSDLHNLQERGKKVREIIRELDFPPELKSVIIESYGHMEEQYGKGCDVAVRSSATAEDLPDASFAGQQETYLNIRGPDHLIDACKRCFASLFTDRAISYREEKKFDHFNIALSIGVQKMVRSDLACSGVMFSIDTESGFRDAALITGTHKKQFVINDDEILKLAEWACVIEDHYTEKRGKPTPMDMEWAKDGETGELFIVQARPETVHSQKDMNYLEKYVLKEKGNVLVKGHSVGEKIGSGKINIIREVKDIHHFNKGEILVTEMTDPDWEPIMKIASAIVTNRGGRTCHAAIISRELGIPCVVGTTNGTEKLNNGQEVTVDCSQGDEGYVYEGKIHFDVEKTNLAEIPKTKTKIMMNLANPEQAFEQSFIPNSGVGLARMEFIVNYIKVHPLALLHFDKVTDSSTRKKIEEMTYGYENKADYFVNKLAEGVGRLAAAFYPKTVILRMSDFKTNEYASLIGGKDFEPKEDNPMIGWRGASRYYSGSYVEGFALECRAIKKVREEFGLTNLEVMIPFCRTLNEAHEVIRVMGENGLKQGENGLKVIGMCEIPSNVILADQFLDIWDGFSIGTNDLTQLTLGVDRDSELVAHVYDERNDAVKTLVKQVIETANRKGKYIGICGQAPSDYIEFAEFVVECGIQTMSLNPDTVIKTTLKIAELEKKMGISPE